MSANGTKTPQKTVTKSQKPAQKLNGIPFAYAII